MHVLAVVGKRPSEVGTRGCLRCLAAILCTLSFERGGDGSALRAPAEEGSGRREPAAEDSGRPESDGECRPDAATGEELMAFLYFTFSEPENVPAQAAPELLGIARG